MVENFSISAARLSGLVPLVIGWTADQFWNATPAELATIFSAFAGHDPGHFGQTPLGTEQLERLKESFPDG